MKITEKARILALQGLVARREIRRQRYNQAARDRANFQAFADDLNQIRLDRGLTFEELAEVAAMTPDRVREVLWGDMECDIKEVVSLCLALNQRAVMTMTPIEGGKATVIPIGSGGR